MLYMLNEVLWFLYLALTIPQLPLPPPPPKQPPPRQFGKSRF